MGIMDMDKRRAYAQGLVDHASAVRDKLAALPPDIAEHIRTTYQLHLYPLGFIDDKARELMTGSGNQSSPEHSEPPRRSEAP